VGHTKTINIPIFESKKIARDFALIMFLCAHANTPEPPSSQKRQTGWLTWLLGCRARNLIEEELAKER